MAKVKVGKAVAGLDANERYKHQSGIKLWGCGIAIMMVLVFFVHPNIRASWDAREIRVREFSLHRESEVRHAWIYLAVAIPLSAVACTYFSSAYVKRQGTRIFSFWYLFTAFCEEMPRGSVTFFATCAIGLESAVR